MAMVRPSGLRATVSALAISVTVCSSVRVSGSHSWRLEPAVTSSVPSSLNAEEHFLDRHFAVEHLVMGAPHASHYRHAGTVLPAVLPGFLDGWPCGISLQQPRGDGSFVAAEFLREFAQETPWAQRSASLRSSPGAHGLYALGYTRRFSSTVYALGSSGSGAVRATSSFTVVGASRAAPGAVGTCR
ncbi:hypothetical protein DEJ46_01445 [Streptomyces venezuelae]|uniref:Uncharacterized protein n=1 Tax=Streptomyces venezuelae TaxID=54571 RepID=A0A5P2AK73_STRVZ|nr:hypothetical protein DEJ46_01445 [Streptomyces venezuelae]